MNATTAANGAEPVAARIDTSPLRAPTSIPTSAIEQSLFSERAKWRKQRDRLDDLEASFSAERNRTVESYQKRMQALKNELLDHLHDFDLRYAAALADGRRKLAERERELAAYDAARIS